MIIYLYTHPPTAGVCTRKKIDIFLQLINVYAEKIDIFFTADECVCGKIDIFLL